MATQIESNTIVNNVLDTYLEQYLDTIPNTNNILKDIITILTNGDDIVIYSGKIGRWFLTNNNRKGNMKRHVYIDVYPHISLLDDGEWEWYITNNGFIEGDITEINKDKNNNIIYFKIN